VRIETFNQLINVGDGRQFTVSKAHQNKSRNCIENKKMSNPKTSIRFFDDREVRAVWDEENAMWWFSVLDIVAVFTVFSSQSLKQS